jgi:hypothetical protein
MAPKEQITRRLLAPIAIQDGKNKVVSVDLGAFVRRVLLSDTYILQSVWLEDVALLAGVFGPGGLTQLFQAGALKIYCESYAVGETGRMRADLNFPDNNKRLPLGSYSFSVLRVTDQDKKIENALVNLGAEGEEASRHLVSISLTDFSAQVFEGFYGDLRHNQSVVKAAIANELRKQGIKPKRLQTLIEETDPEDFRVETNIVSEYGMSGERAHQIVLRALMALSGLDQRFAEMKTHSALCGITEADRPLLQGKFSMVASLVDSSNHERRFERVLSIAGMPNPVIGDTNIDVEKLLKVRESDECRAFRDWLASTDSLSDKELKERISGMTSKIRQALNSKLGKGIRFLISNGLSFAGPAGVVAGPLASVIDAFILERLAPKDAILSFLIEGYPSLLKRE